MKRSMALGALVVALGAGGAALVQKAAAGGAAAARQTDGGLSVMPAVIEVPNAHTGGLAQVTVANRSAAPMSVTLTPRQWLQGADGKVSPNRRGALAGVSVTEGAFTLAPGQEKEVTLNLNTSAANGIYGALEAVGLPTDVATRKGVVLGYRVVGAIRLTPAAPKAAITAGKIKPGKGTAVLPVKNTGNTLDAVTGNLSVKDASGTRNTTVQAVKILPGKTINLSLGTKLTKGSATAKVTLNQKGKRAVKFTKKFTVR
jgi:hypothetical protein